MLWLLGNHWQRSGTASGEGGKSAGVTLPLLGQKKRREKKQLLSKKMKGNPGSGLSEANQVENCNHINVTTLIRVAKLFDETQKKRENVAKAIL